ncbi:HAD-IC family P-type ATPase [Leifsonia sp. Root112D2]|uniref:HAD-IC family P-type ATPase n=1 Tax=Leifsonia sp. Root112D2 TaxID=1736426 RepID=UPI0006FF5CD5|nr:HAD-IC family P-type ATPase [Leifsonia sp. Root112D2]KQV08005.1 ATPase [Leifsonia sp. Root112D2]
MAQTPGRDGLTSAQVAERHASGRGNDVAQPTSRTVADILRENVFTLFNGILTACFIAIALLGDLRDGFFFGVVVVNALIGIVQELRAKIVLDKAALLAAPEATVKRDGVVTSVPLASVVLDDLLVLRPGDQLPADARIVESVGLSIDESLLTGESEPVVKDVDAQVLSGSHVLAGTGYAVVTAVGADSYAHRLTAQIRRHSLVHSELRHATNRILVYISWILGPLILITLVGRIFTYGGWHELWLQDRWRHAVVDVVASVVGMIPEGLVLLISLAFGVAAVQLARRKVLVQELAAVEVLARVDVLCLDKTGTLTTGELTFDRIVELPGVPLESSELALAAFGADDAANATARILSEHFRAEGIQVERRVPFSSSARFSGVSLVVDGVTTGWLLGAPERLLEAHPAELAQATSLAALGHRTLALVRCADGLPDSTLLQPEAPSLTPAALIAFRETVRAEAPATLRYFAEQGVRVVIMSGDSPVTVSAVADSLGLGGRTADAAALADETALQEALGDTNAFGRVAPEQKRSAVEIMQRLGHTVAMTGDGINDALAIKSADLGIAMGTASAATKAVSRLVLLDDRFDRLPDVLALGRRVIANVERVANIFLAKTVYGIVLALVSAIVLWRFPFLPRQLTLVSTLAIGIPSFVLALTPNRRIYQPGVLRRVLLYSIPTGFIAAATCIIAYIPLHSTLAPDAARSATTLALFCVSLWIVCVLARPLSLARIALLAAMAIAFLLVCVLPFTRAFFEMTVFVDAALGYALVVGIAGSLGIEFFYRFARRHGLVFDRV